MIKTLFGYEDDTLKNSIIARSISSSPLTGTVKVVIEHSMALKVEHASTDTLMKIWSP